MLFTQLQPVISVVRSLLKYLKTNTFVWVFYFVVVVEILKRKSSSSIRCNFFLAQTCHAFEQSGHQ